MAVADVVLMDEEAVHTFSAYVVADPSSRPPRTSTARLPSVSEGAIDPLADADEESAETAAGVDAAARGMPRGMSASRDAATTWPANARDPLSQPTFSLWRS